MEQFKGRSFFIKDEKELERVKRMISRSCLKIDSVLFVKFNECKTFNHLYFSCNKFILISNHNLPTKNYSISTLQRLLKNVR